MQHPAVRIHESKGSVPGPRFQELLHCGHHHQQGRIGGVLPAGNHRVGQQRQQGQEALILLQRHVAGRAVLDPGIEQCQQK